MSYRPRRASKRWLEGAPEYVLDCFDNKGKTYDRYTVLFGGTLIDEEYAKFKVVSFLGMSNDPSHPLGFSQWGEVDSTWRPSRDRVRWLDLPENVRKHIIARVES